MWTETELLQKVAAVLYSWPDPSKWPIEWMKLGYQEVVHIAHISHVSTPMWPQTTQNSPRHPVWCVLWSIVPEINQSNPILDEQRFLKKHSFMIFLAIYLFHVFFLTLFLLFICRGRLTDRVGGELPAKASIRYITNASNMDIKFLSTFDPNCRLNFYKSGKLVAILILPDTLHRAPHPVCYYPLRFAQSCRTLRVCKFS